MAQHQSAKAGHWLAVLTTNHGSFSLAKSATTHVSNVNILTNVQITSPGCTKSPQGWQMPHYTTIYDSVDCHWSQTPSLRPPRRKPSGLFSPHPPWFLPLWVKKLFPPRSPTQTGKGGVPLTALASPPLMGKPQRRFPAINPYLLPHLHYPYHHFHLFFHPTCPLSGPLFSCIFPNTSPSLISLVW